MPNTKNQNQAEQIKQALAQSKAVILTNYAGLNLSSQTELRRLIKQSGGQFTVAKNTLLKLALKDQLSNESEDVLKALEGPTAVLWAIDDAVTPTKALVQFAADHDLPQVKLGFLDGRILSKQDIINLAKLPSRQELLGQLAGQLNAPIYSFAQVLRANIQNLVFVVDNIKRAKDSN